MTKHRPSQTARRLIGLQYQAHGTTTCLVHFYKAPRAAHFYGALGSKHAHYHTDLYYHMALNLVLNGTLLLAPCCSAYSYKNVWGAPLSTEWGVFGAETHITRTADGTSNVTTWHGGWDQQKVRKQANMTATFTTAHRNYCSSALCSSPVGPFFFGGALILFQIIFPALHLYCT